MTQRNERMNQFSLKRILLVGLIISILVTSTPVVVKAAPAFESLPTQLWVVSNRQGAPIFTGRDLETIPSGTGWASANNGTRMGVLGFKQQGAHVLVAVSYPMYGDGWNGEFQYVDLANGWQWDGYSPTASQLWVRSNRQGAPIYTGRDLETIPSGTGWASANNGTRMGVLGFKQQGAHVLVAVSYPMYGDGWNGEFQYVDLANGWQWDNQDPITAPDFQLQTITFPSEGDWVSFDGSTRPTATYGIVMATTMTVETVDYAAVLAALQAAGIAVLEAGVVVIGVVIIAGCIYIALAYPMGGQAQSWFDCLTNYVFMHPFAANVDDAAHAYCGWIRPQGLSRMQSSGSSGDGSASGLTDGNGNPRFSCDQVYDVLADLYAHETSPTGRGIWIPEKMRGSHPHGFLGGKQYTTWNLVYFLSDFCPAHSPKWGMDDQYGQPGTLIP